MERMDFDRATVTPLQSVFDSARSFGLTAEEVMRTFDQAFWIVGEDGCVGDYLDQLNSALARRILDKQRTTG